MKKKYKLLINPYQKDLKYYVNLIFTDEKITTKAENVAFYKEENVFNVNSPGFFEYFPRGNKVGTLYISQTMADLPVLVHELTHVATCFVTQFSMKSEEFKSKSEEECVDYFDEALSCHVEILLKQVPKEKLRELLEKDCIIDVNQ